MSVDKKSNKFYKNYVKDFGKGQVYNHIKDTYHTRNKRLKNIFLKIFLICFIDPKVKVQHGHGREK